MIQKVSPEYNHYKYPIQNISSTNQPSNNQSQLQTIPIQSNDKQKVYLQNEIQRYKKKLQLEQKTKSILEDQINVLRNQIADQNQKINQLLYQIDIDNIAKQSSNNNHLQQYYEIKIKTMHTEYQQEKQLLKMQMQSTKKQYQNLYQNYKQIQQKVLIEQNISNRKIQTLQIQIQYHIKKEQDLAKEVGQLSCYLQQYQQKQKKNIQEINKKWWNINTNLLQKVTLLQQVIKKSYQEIQNLKDQLKCQTNKVNQIKQDNQQLNNQMSWYLQLIQQTKSHYINSQLQKQTLVKKLEEQKKQLVKQSRITKNNSQYNKSTFNQSQSRIAVYRLSVPHQKTPDKIQQKIKNFKIIKGNTLKSQIKV